MARSEANLKSPPVAVDAFGVAEVSRLFAIPQRRLRYWSQTGFIRPSLRRGNRSLYSFRDLIAVKVARALLERGVSVRRVQRSLATLRASLRDGIDLLSLRIRGEGDSVVVDDGDRRFDLKTGQYVFEFEVAELKRDVAQVVSLPWVEPSHADRSAYDWFLLGCEHEEAWGGAPADTEGFEHAREAYEQALRADPALAAARTNLGSMYAEIGDFDSARALFEAALDDDPHQPQALCNLAELALREDDHDGAISGFQRVLQSEPAWLEAHYGLARAFLEIGEKALALAHLERFCTETETLAISEDPQSNHRQTCAAQVVARLRRELAGP